MASRLRRRGRPGRLRSAGWTASIVSLGVAAFLGGCTGGLLRMRPCVPAPGLRARCGTYLVPEDRSRPWSRKIGLNLVVVPPTGPDPAPDPIFFLAGGPGEPATALTRALAAGALGPLRKHRALVLVDQRGTGRSEPLTCKLVGKEGAFRQALRLDLLPPKGLRRCRKKLDADPTEFVTPVAMDDLDAVRAALGYETINLLGGSYGTRAALVYMRRHPKHVRSAVLSNVSPPSRAAMLHSLGAAQRSFSAVVRACARDARCHAAFPSPERDLAAVLRSLPRQARIRQPRSGAPLTVTITPALVRLGLRALLYTTPSAATIPLVLKRASRGDFGPLTAAVGTLGSLVLRYLSAGMYLSVWCSEYVPLYTPADLARQDRSPLGADPLLRLTERACRDWPTRRLPESYFRPIRSAVPTLLMSGELDPATPPAVAEEVARRLSRARHVVFVGESHRIGNDACFARLAADFFERPGASDFDATCARKGPPLRFALPGHAAR